MNQHLQTILNLIQQSDHLSAEEKTALSKAAKAADKELETTAFKLERTEKVKHTTAVLLEETIVELEQKRKAVEAQNREFEIEAALERVRSQSMGMHKSEELAEAASVMFDQLRLLGGELWSCGFVLCEPDRAYTEQWLSLPEGGMLPPFSVPVDLNSYLQGEFDAWKRGDELFMDEVPEEDIKHHYEQLSTIPVLQSIFENIQQLGISQPTWQRDHVASFKQGYLLVITTEPFEEVSLFVRFAKVFEQTYTRFLDLQKAEAQAREAQIEAALEKVRSSSMAMHKSDELQKVINVVTEQFQQLGFQFDTANFIINYSDSGGDWWISTPGVSIPANVYFPSAPISFFNKLVNAIHTGKDFFTASFSYEEKNEFFNHAFENTNLKYISEERKQYIYNSGGIASSSVISKNVILSIANYRLTHYTDEENAIIKRIGKVFEQSYVRFLDLQKAEAQVREAQIQLALERVRARTMAMQKSYELAETVSILFKQLLGLGIKSTQMRTCAIVTLKPDEPIGECWITKPDGDIIPQSFMVPYDETSAYKTIYDAWKQGEKFLVVHLSGDALLQHLNFLKKYAKIPTQQFQASADQPMETFTHAMFFSQGYLFIISNEPLPEYQDIFKRFGNVFEQTYTRFLDLKKAEDQAREAQVEVALERLRSRMLRMQKSSELEETTAVMYQQLDALGIVPEGCIVYIVIIDRATDTATQWIVSDETLMITPGGELRVPLNEDPRLIETYEGWKRQDPLLIRDLSGEALEDFKKYIKSLPSFREGKSDVDQWPGRMVWSEASFSNGTLGLIYTTTLPEATLAILVRFSKVFDLTYTRFLDLKKAEDQTREAQIEAALERVRSRTMGMQKSEELKEVIQVVYEQFVHLNIQVEHTGFIMDYKERNDMHIWLADKHAVPFQVTIPYFDSEHWNSFIEAKEKGTDFFANHLSFEEKNRFYQDLFKLIPGVPEETLEYYFSCPGLAISTVLLENIGLYIENFSGIAYSDEENTTLMRFGKVFQQTYTRFLDLQKAEAQAREATIEAALERVRSRSMGMQKSEELSAVIQVIYEQLIQLNFVISNAGFLMDFRKSDDFNLWMSDAYTEFPTKVSIPYINHPQMNCFKEAKAKGLDFLTYSLTLEEKNKWFEYCFKIIDVPNQAQKMAFDFPGLATSAVLLENISLYLLNYAGTPYSEAQNATLMRFGKVFEQTYTRFNDLKQAEAQALEAIKRASVDRVRAEIASMRTSTDLEKITPLIWNELTTLGVPFIRCGVFIMDEELQQVNTLLSDQDGKAIAAFHQPFSTPGEIAAVIKSWRKKEMYRQHWDETQFNAFTKDLVEQGAITSGEKYLTENRPTNLYLHFLPFLQGMLYAGNSAPLSDDELQLVQNLADAFATAYARYEDFNKLESANVKIEKTLVDLKQAQAQLVQSEKMASLGELTAGIAHEIQNPLNFVNNFSEVNKELLAELNEEIEKGNYEEVKIIAKDVIGNEEKISHHGKRADAIVKGMLQHSRSSSATKEPTDINKLADEYLRLAYHGLRAKDKEFNATMKTDYDETIGSVNIIPQDIGRVLLNLFNNAFYAVTERKKQQSDGYEPIVSISTNHSLSFGEGRGEVRISVKDNGNGIPQKVVDKIFQPFFTTKPTGQGTGLGLSLSYDIIKAHGGEIKVETNEGEGTTFIIQLPIN